MKRNIIALWIVLLLSLPVSAQQEKKKVVGFDVQLAQQIGLKNWSGVSSVDDGFPKASLTELKGVFNIRFGRSCVGAFADAGIGLMPAPKMGTFTTDRMEMPHSGTKYYLREMLSESGSRHATPHFKAATGLFMDIQAGEKVRVMPYVGVGFMTMSGRSYTMILKEQGSNLEYRARYSWNESEYGTDTSAPGYLTGRLNVKYKVAQKMSLLLGLEYMWVFDRLNYSASFSNVYNQNIEKVVHVQGERMSMLGLSLGLSFF